MGKSHAQKTRDDEWINITSSQDFAIKGIDFVGYKAEYETKFKEKINELLF